MLFRETLVGPRWLAIAGGAVLVFLAIVTAVSAPIVVASVAQIGGWMIVLLAVAFVIILGAGLVGIVRRISISVNATHVDAYLAPFRVMHIPLAQVHGVTVADVSPAQAGGIGWRIVGSDRFMVWSAGSAAWLSLNNGS